MSSGHECLKGRMTTANRMVTRHTHEPSLSWTVIGRHYRVMPSYNRQSGGVKGGLRLTISR